MNINQNKLRKALKRIGIIFLVLLGIVCVGFALVCQAGKYTLKRQAVTASHEPLGSADSYIEPSQLIEYEGKKYRYNDKLYVILCMGIDTENDMRTEGTPTAQTGQADAIFLAVLDEKQKRISVIAIPRDTMTAIDFYDVTGGYADTIQEQLALQFAYGNGGSKSCEMMMRAVSGLMCQMPINGYAAFSLNSIEALNGLVLGVEVTLEEDFEAYKAGETVWLDNATAYRFVRGRDCAEDYSADARLRRQKQYLVNFIDRVIACTKEDITRPFLIYNAVSDSLLTNISKNSIFSMALLGINCEFSETYFYRVPGEQQLGEVYEEYHVDEAALYELILKVFYLEEP